MESKNAQIIIAMLGQAIRGSKQQPQTRFSYTMSTEFDFGHSRRIPFYNKGKIYIINIFLIETLDPSIQIKPETIFKWLIIKR